MKISHEDNKSCNRPKDLKEQIAWETKRKEKELYTWQTLIQPIIDGYGIEGIEYEFVPFWDEYGNVINKETTPVDIYEMERFILDLSNGRPFNSFEGLLRKWQNSTAGDTFSYKDFFIDFITHLFEKDTLPHFLEFLSKNVPATTKQKEADPFWPYLIPPKPIERKSVEKALWDKHIDPIVKTHNLRNKDGEFFQYRFIDKEIDEHGVLIIMRKTMLMKDMIKTTLAQQGIPETEFEQIDPYYAGYSLMELIKGLKRREKGNTIKPVTIKIGENTTIVDIDDAEVFHLFLEDLFNDETLPEFLETLRRDDEKIAEQTNRLYLNYPPQLHHSNNPTDCNIDIDSSPYSVPDGDQLYSDVWQRQAANDANQKGGIRLYDLVFILAKDECYNDMIPKLWDYSGYNNDTSNRFPNWKDVIAKNKQGRAWAWYWLLCRWTIFEKPKIEGIDSFNELESYYFSDLKKINLLRLYIFENGLFKEVLETQEQSPKHYIKLSEFENYIKNIDPIIALPKILSRSVYESRNLLKQAKPEIEILYSAIKTFGRK